ncbi:hypothetical protein T492DRAFT_836688 [Pavlovales sp. CCMP2436]|nr:hypothetical protein T492DRAFT_836688 [Pavlovales sp. CCMP2436]
MSRLHSVRCSPDAGGGLNSTHAGPIYIIDHLFAWQHELQSHFTMDNSFVSLATRSTLPSVHVPSPSHRHAPASPHPDSKQPVVHVIKDTPDLRRPTSSSTDLPAPTASPPPNLLAPASPPPPPALPSPAPPPWKLPSSRGYGNDNGPAALPLPLPAFFGWATAEPAAMASFSPTSARLRRAAFFALPAALVAAALLFGAAAAVWQLRRRRRAASSLPMPACSRPARGARANAVSRSSEPGAAALLAYVVWPGLTKLELYSLELLAHPCEQQRDGQ